MNHPVVHKTLVKNFIVVRLQLQTTPVQYDPEVSNSIAKAGNKV